ncbi:2-hydroxy-3-oxopropionate reductase [Prosthecomicrobium pneumaticum]|uniref:2-hydroxy-3-oxopropionate reductase n=1 Tax=Prosthecomicrobium pneumaticum TaxID=81895 RepID=A0A7W9FQV3_9HYPH|nr:2-hydroxy-3-oxopropionate reductase [Prosthecomicrobium pneumaticum]MBB5755185.1 2-hydroxy-3-oxopropionate reductase [Prosthecomicrobium pneumaticum]
MRIAFIGLGVMGRPMAGHLIAAGHRLFLKTRRGVPEDLVAAGGTACATVAEATAAADLVITMLPDTPDVETVLFGADGVAAAVEGRTVVDMSSISPLATQDFARRIAAAGGDYLDAPVSGGEVGAKAATLTIMVGGSETAFAHVKPVLEAMGKNVTRVGAVGHGQIAKVANQIIVALTIEAVAEALVFASKAGADPALVRQAITGGLATSRILELHAPRMIEGKFDPGFRIALHQKDLELALSNARALGMALPNTASTQQLFNLCTALGGAAWDHSGLVRAIEAMAGHRIADRTAP